MAQPIADGDGFVGKIYVAGTGDDRSAATADIFITAADQNGTNAGNCAITWDNLDGIEVSAAGTDGVTFTII